MYSLLSVLVVLVAISMVPTVLSAGTSNPIDPNIDFTVPSWIKNNAGWWADGQIDDSSFVSGIQWLILNDVITIQSTQQGAGDGDNVIPNWVKNTAGWWAEDKIHDITFVAGIKFLINEGIMIVGQVEQAEAVEECTFKGILVPCSDREVVVEINDFYMEINSGSCSTCLNWAYVGKEYNFQIETYDEKRGNYIDGVEINVKIISKGGEVRHNFGQVTTEDGIYKNSITIPSMDWYAENLLFVTGEYYGIEKTIEKEFTVFRQIDGANPSASVNTGGSCTEVSPISVTSQDDSPEDITFNNDGTKMFIVGDENNKVSEYTLAGPYCLNAVTFVDACTVCTHEGSPRGVTFNTDGSKMYIVGRADDAVVEYNLSENFDVSTASYAGSGEEFSTATQNETPTDITFNTDGTKMFIVENDDDVIHEYTLSENFDVSTASYVDGFDVTAQDTSPESLAFNTEGTKMYVSGRQNDKVYEYNLSENFDVSTASFVDAFSVASEDTSPRGLTFDPSGKYLIILGDENDKINIYKLSEPFDVSTAVVQSG